MSRATLPAALVLALVVAAPLAFAASIRVVSVGAVRFQIETRTSGVVCFQALRPGVEPGHSPLSACVPHLRRSEIAFVLAKRHTGQQMIAGLAGADVRRVYVRLSPERVWTPRREHGAFFGYVPTGSRAAYVVKVLRDGSSRSFRVTGRP